MGDPAENPERFREASPFFFMDEIGAPVQLIAGAWILVARFPSHCRPWKLFTSLVRRWVSWHTRMRVMVTGRSRTRLMP